MTSRGAPPSADGGNASLSLSERLRQARNSRRASTTKPEVEEESSERNGGHNVSTTIPLAERYRPYSSAVTSSDAKSTVGSQVSSNLSSADGGSSAVSTRSWRNIHALVQKLDATVESNQSRPAVPPPTTKVTASYSMPHDTTQPAWKYRNLHTLTSPSKVSEDHSAHSSTSNSTQPTDHEPVPSVVVPSSQYPSSEATNVVSRWNHRTATKQDLSTKPTVATSQPVRRKWTPPAVAAPEASTPSSAPAAPHSYVPVTQYSFVPSPTIAVSDRKPSPRHGGDDPSALSLATSYSFASQASSRRSESPRKGTGGGRSPTAPFRQDKPADVVLSTSRSFGSPQRTTKGVVATENATVPAWKKSLSSSKGPEVAAPPVPAWKKKLQEQRKLQEEQRQVKAVPKWKKKAEEIAPSSSSVTDLHSLPSDEAAVAPAVVVETPMAHEGAPGNRFPRGGVHPSSTVDPSKAWFARTHPVASVALPSEAAIPSGHADPSAVASFPSEETASPEKDDPAEQLGIGEAIYSVSAQRLRLRNDAGGAPAVHRSNQGGWESPRTAILKAKEEKQPSNQAPVPTRTLKGKSPVTALPNSFKTIDSAGKIIKPVAIQKSAPPTVVNEPELKSNANVTDGSNDDGSTKVSVAEVKAKLWGGGKAEKLVTSPPRVKDKGPSADAVLSSPLRFHGTSDAPVFPPTTSPPKPIAARTPVVSPLLPKSTRGRPDVCTPNGPLPPPRGRQVQDPPPRKNMDTLWMQRMEQAAQTDDAALSPQRTLDVPSVDVDQRTSLDPSGKVALEMPPLPGNEDSPPPPPPADQTNHHRSPSVGDFQIASNSAKKIVIEDVSYEMASPPVSPRITRVTDPISPTIRPAVMPKWDSPIPKSGSTSPTSRPPKLPPTSPLATEPKEKAGFVETIDCPPLDDAAAEAKWAGDADITGPQEATEAPRPKAPDRPWTKDSGALSPSSWRKNANATEEDLIAAATRLDHLTDSETLAEEKKCTDSPTSSLVRMAADSIHAIEYEQAVRGLQRPNVTEEDDDESVQSFGAAGSSIPAVVPPEFANAIGETVEPPVPIFGDPISFGAAGGETTAEPMLTVADRAKAIASWNGGLGAAPSLAKADHNLLPSEEIASSLSPIRHEASDTEVDGMSPRVSKRGFGIEDWNRNKSFDSRSEHETSSDFWQPSSLDHPVDDKDWSKCDPEMDAVATSRSDDVSKETADVPIRVSAPRRGGTPPLLSKPKSDTDPKPKMTWRKKPLIPKSETSTPPKQSQSKAPMETKPVPSTQAPSSVWKDKAIEPAEIVAFEAFDPFEYSFNGGEKVEFTETTEFTENNDMFESLNGDPFPVDPSSFPSFEPKLVAPPSGGDDGYEEDSDSIPNIASLARPSGSSFGQYELWSYDADTSGLHEGAAEI